MAEIEVAAWTSFVAVVKSFLGQNKVAYYQEVVENDAKKLPSSWNKNEYQNPLPEYLGDVNEEQGELFYQNIKTMEE